MFESLRTNFQTARDWVNDPAHATFVFATPGLVLAVNNMFQTKPTLPGCASLLLAFATLSAWKKTNEIMDTTAARQSAITNLATVISRAADQKSGNQPS